MELEKIVQLLIFIHAATGGMALLFGAIALIAKKGSAAHKKSGKLFYYSMLTAAVISFIVAVMPDHESPFLFSIGVFSCYFLISGYRSLNFKHKNFNVMPDNVIAILIILTGISMIIYPVLFYGKINIILCVFGLVGLAFGSRDLVLFNNLKKLKQDWLKLHLGKMTGGYIASVTAFFVVNEILPGIYNWFAPGIIGGAYITYWILKLNKRNRKHDNSQN